MFIEDYNDFLRNLKVETMSNLALLNPSARNPWLSSQ